MPTPALLDRGLHRELGDERHLGRARDGAYVRAAVGEDLLGCGLLEVVASDLVARDVRRDREDRSAVPLAVVEPVEEMQAAGAGRAEHRSGSSRNLRCRTGRKSACLFVADMDELDLGSVPTHRVDDWVRGITHDPEDMGDPGPHHQVDEGLRNGLRHVSPPRSWVDCASPDEHYANPVEHPTAATHGTCHYHRGERVCPFEIVRSGRLETDRRHGT